MEMNKVFQATYRNGSLILDEKLDVALEGKKLTLILVEDSASSNHIEISSEERKQRFLEKLKTYLVKLPENYKFDREEIHDRDCFHRF
jgi:predicted DNA-binding antitoxin AbrB/MazE fold protein